MLHNRLTPDRKLLRKQFPVAMIRNRPMPNRKPFANSFLSVYYTIVPCRTGNFSQTVSCRGYTQSSHDEQETFRKQFPAAMLHNRLTPDRKPFANSFLSVYYTIVPCRTGNFSQTVSCRNDSQSFHAGQETIRKQFPVAMLHNRLTPDRKLLRKQLPAVMNHIRVPPDILIPPWTLHFSGPAEYPP